MPSSEGPDPRPWEQVVEVRGSFGSPNGTGPPIKNLPVASRQKLTKKPSLSEPHRIDHGDDRPAWSFGQTSS